MTHPTGRPFALDLPAGPCLVRLDGPADAPPLLLSNSLSSDHTMWDGQVEALARVRRVVRLDSRGHGGTAAPPGPWRIEDLADDALAVLDALGVDRVDWLGLSMGGMVGMALAAARPDRVGRLVLANTSAHMPPPELWNGRIRTAERGGMTPLVEPTLERWFTAAFRAAAPGEIARVRAMIARTPVAGYIGCCGAIRDMDLRERLDRIKAPTLVIVGEHDPSTTPADGALIASRIPGAALVRLDAAHVSNIEAPDAFNAAVLRVLDGR